MDHRTEIAAVATHHCVDRGCIYLGQPTNGISCGCHKTPEQMLWDRIRRLEADLAECREYLEVYVDVVDGDYGEPSPNRAMKLVTMIDETLNGPGGA